MREFRGRHFAFINALRSAPSPLLWLYTWVPLCRPGPTQCHSQEQAPDHRQMFSFCSTAAILYSRGDWLISKVLFIYNRIVNVVLEVIWRKKINVHYFNEFTSVFQPRYKQLPLRIKLTIIIHQVIKFYNIISKLIHRYLFKI